MSKTAAKKARKTVVAVRVRRPRGRVAGSMTEQVNTLEIGQSVSLARRFDISDRGTDEESIKAELESMRGTLGSIRNRVHDDDDGLDMRTFKTESGVFVSDDKTAIIAAVVLTRID